MTAHLITRDECSKTIELPFDIDVVNMPILNKANWDTKTWDENTVTYRTYRRTAQRTPEGVSIYREIFEPTTTP